ncbi:MAG TPA: hypothetical protein VF456_00030 [Vicinamibacterales bacterium]
MAYVPARSLQAGDRGKYLGDPTLAVAILDRLAMDHSIAVRGSIPDRRLWVLHGHPAAADLLPSTSPCYAIGSAAPSSRTIVRRTLP